jgi:hypothetical protein
VFSLRLPAATEAPMPEITFPRDWLSRESLVPKATSVRGRVRSADRPSDVASLGLARPVLGGALVLLVAWAAGGCTANEKTVVIQETTVRQVAAAPVRPSVAGSSIRPGSTRPVRPASVTLMLSSLLQQPWRLGRARASWVSSDGLI